MRDTPIARGVKQGAYASEVARQLLPPDACTELQQGLIFFQLLVSGRAWYGHRVTHHDRSALLSARIGVGARADRPWRTLALFNCSTGTRFIQHYQASHHYVPCKNKSVVLVCFSGAGQITSCGLLATKRVGKWQWRFPLCVGTRVDCLVDQ